MEVRTGCCESIKYFASDVIGTKNTKQQEIISIIEAHVQDVARTSWAAYAVRLTKEVVDKMSEL